MLLEQEAAEQVEDSITCSLMLAEAHKHNCTRRRRSPRLQDQVTNSQQGYPLKHASQGVQPCFWWDGPCELQSVRPFVQFIIMLPGAWEGRGDSAYRRGWIYLLGTVSKVSQHGNAMAWLTWLVSSQTRLKLIKHWVHIGLRFEESLYVLYASCRREEGRRAADKPFVIL